MIHRWNETFKKSFQQQQKKNIKGNNRKCRQGKKTSKAL